MDDRSKCTPPQDRVHIVVCVTEVSRYLNKCIRTSFTYAVIFELPLNIFNRVIISGLELLVAEMHHFRIVVRKVLFFRSFNNALNIYR
jgi:hypothetical protein